MFYVEIMNTGNGDFSLIERTLKGDEKSAQVQVVDLFGMRREDPDVLRRRESGWTGRGVQGSFLTMNCLATRFTRLRNRLRVRNLRLMALLPI
jgi:hypothetical protein